MVSLRRPLQQLSGVVFGLVAVTGLLPAQARPDTTARPIQPVVVRGIRGPAVVGGASAVVADVDSMRLPAAPVLDQALRELPFILVRRNTRGETELSVRGSDSRQAAVMVDGVPLTLGWDHRGDPSLVPLTGAQSVTLVRGLSSLLHGPNSLGGVVEVALTGGGAGRAEPRGMALATDVDQFGGTGVSLSGRTPLDGDGRVTLRAGAGYRDRPGFALGRDIADLGDDRDLRTNSDIRHFDGFASLRYRTPAGGFAGLTLSAFDAERGVPPELHVAEPRLWRYPEQRRALAVATAGTGARTTPWGTGGVQASLGVNAGSVRIESFDTPQYEQVVETESGDERTITGRVLAEHSLGGAMVRAAATLADVTYDETVNEDPATRYRQRLWSVASEVTAPIGSRVQVAGGVAVDGADTPETGGRESLGALGRVGGRLGVTAALPSDVRLHLSASRRSRFPALRELYSGALDRFLPNPELRPETLLGFEAGATRTWASGAELQGVAFQHYLEDAVVRTTLPDRRFFRENRNEIRSTGVELLGGWRHASGVSLLADVTAQRVRVRDVLAAADAARAEHQPELQGGVTLGVPLPFAIRGLASVRHTGRQYCTNPDLGAQEVLGSQTSGDLQAERSWSLGRAASALFRTMRVTLAVDNVADAAAYDICGLPMPGRTARVMVELR